MPKITRSAPASLKARSVQEAILLVGEVCSGKHTQKAEEAVVNGKGRGDNHIQLHQRVEWACRL